eukprot:771-Heterococcus_DN1.PRE.1
MQLVLAVLLTLQREAKTVLAQQGRSAKSSNSAYSTAYKDSLRAAVPICTRVLQISAALAGCAQQQQQQ